MVRTMRADDLNAVIRIWLEANLRAHDFIKASYWREHCADVRDAIAQAEVRVYVQEQRVLGFIGLHDTLIEGLFVQPDQCGMGIGKALLDAAKKENGHLMLHVYEKNQRALRFYSREGFRIQSRRVDSDTGESEFVMSWNSCAL